ncbi:MAG: hypothetical protein WCY62_10790 [Clostridia bacterium]
MKPKDLLMGDITLDDNDMAILEAIDKEIDATLKKISIFELQTNKQMSDIVSNEINIQGEKISKLVEMASPTLRGYIIEKMNEMKDTYLN